MLRDILLIVPFCVFIAAVAWPYWRAAGADPGSGIERVLRVSVLTFAHLTLSGLVLGAVGWWTPPALLALNAAGAAALAVAFRGVRPAHREPIAPDPTYRGLWLVLIALALAAGGGLAVLGARLPPLAWDEVSYHLPMAALMLQRGSLFLGDFYLPLIDGYPKNIQMWFSLILGFFGSDRWVDLGQLPFAAVGVLATTAIARRLGTPPSPACSGGLLLLFAPLTLLQLRTAYIDVAHAALVLAGIALCLARVQGERHWTARASLAACVGLLAGVKFSSLLYSLGLVALYLVLGRRSLARRERVADVTLMAAGFAGLGSFFYVKNLIEHGNPFFPLVVRVAGRVLLDGDMTVEDIVAGRTIGPVALEVIKSWAAVWSAGPSLWHGGLGITWPLLIPAVIGSTIIAVRRRSWARLTVYGFIVAMFLGTPLLWRTRFVLFLLGLGGVAAADVLHWGQASPWIRRGLSVVVCLVACAAIGQAAMASRDSVGWPPDIVPTAMGAHRPIPGVEAPPGTIGELDRGIAGWLAANLRDADRVFAFTCPTRFRDLKPYALWTRRLSNTVEFPAVRDARELESLARRAAGALFVAVRGCPAGGWLESADGFEDVAIDRRLLLRRARR